MEHTLEQLLSGQLAGAKRVQLSCNLTTFPEALFSLADTLEILDLSNNQLTELPSNFAQFTRLKVFFASNNPFTIFPEVLGQCAQLQMIGFKSCCIQQIPNNAFPPALKWLILTNNQLQQLPNDIGNCMHLQKLMLAGNQLQSLPNTLAQCQHLQLLRISANQLTHLPAWLLQMPRLAWLAFSGNPFIQTPPPVASSLPQFAWQHLQINHLLGQGASGNIYHTTHLPTNQQVAVKEFKGQVTSDGLPDDEINACILAGAHPHLVSVLGVVTQHPQQKQALVFDLIPSQYQILGITPSFDSCTRDVYAPNTRFSIAQIVTIATAMAQVCTQLHHKQLSHGDVYAHNILINGQHCIFGDFGAATIYQSLPTSYHLPLQQIEVRAFGYLLDDLLQHADTNNLNSDTMLQQLHQIRQQCLQHAVAERPLFAQILQQLLGGNTTA